MSYEPQRWIVEQIAGKDFKVNVLLPQGSDPESYSPTMGQLRELSRGGIWLHLNTIGFEQSLRRDIPTDGLELIDISKGISLLEHDHDHHNGSHHHDEGEGCEEGSADPHLWSSVRNTKIIAANTLRQLVRLNPDEAERYRANYARLASSLDSLDRELGGALKRSGAKAFMVRHPSLGYFARDYGLTQIAIEDEGKEPSPLQLGRRFRAARNMGVRVMITEPGPSGDQISALARKEGLRPLPVNLNSEEWLHEIQKLKEL